MKLTQFRRRLSPSRLWQRLRHLRIENKGLMLMSLLLAVALFAISRQPLSDVKLFNVPLEYRGQRPDVEISGDITEMVSVRVHGPRDVVRSLLPTQLAVIADLSSKEAGERVVQLRPGDVSLPDNNIRVVQIEPASIRLVLEPKVKKRVSVEAQFIGRLADGLELYGSSAEPDPIEIEGAESQVNKVGRLLTETVNLNGRSKSFQAMVDVETPHTSLRVLTTTPIKLSVEIGERRSFKRFAAIPVQSRNPGQMSKLLTKTVEVELYGPNSALDVLQPKDLHVEIAPDTATGATIATLKVILPANSSHHIEVLKIIPNEV
ncbi:MAG: CdaR family protein, partial [Acidobacteriota bacterium]